MTQQEMYREKFFTKFTALHKTLSCLSDYIDRTTDLKLKCNVCKHEFLKKPKNLVANRRGGCPRCSAERVTNSCRETKLKEQETKIKAFLSKTNTRMIGRQSTYSIKLKCIKCNNEWLGHSSMIFHYKHGGCKPCSQEAVGLALRLRKIDELNSKAQYVKFNLIGNSKRVKGECKKCKSTWETSYDSAKKSGCPACAVRVQGVKRKIKVVKVRGKTFKVNGYENYAIKYLISKGVKAKDINTKTPIVNFRYNKKVYRHIPDFIIGDTIIEVKSPYTMGIDGKMLGKNVLSILKAKAKAAVSLGYKYKVILVYVYKEKPVVLTMPSNWYTYSNSIIRNRTLEKLENVINS